MQYYGVKDTSLVKVPSNIVEAYIPLRMNDGTTTGGAYATAGQYFLLDGSSMGSGTATQLFTLSLNWPSTTQFAFEATISISATGTDYAELWDMTSNTAVSASQISTTATTPTVMRSGKFTLTPGHVYGITQWNSVGGSTASQIADAHLIVFG